MADKRDDSDATTENQGGSEEEQVETSSEADESSQESDAQADSGSEEGTSDESDSGGTESDAEAAESDDDSGKSDDSSSADEGSQSTNFEKRFTQIKGDTPEEYAKNLEEAYRNSSSEAQRLNTQYQETQQKLDSIMATAAKDPEFAKKLNELTGDNAPTPDNDSAVLYARDRMQQDMEREYNEFIEEYPQVATDEELKKDMVQLVNEFGRYAREKEGRIMGMKEALEKAAVYKGLTKERKENEVKEKAKEEASRPRTKSKAKKPSSQPELTEEQKAIAKKMGVSEDDMRKYAQQNK